MFRSIYLSKTDPTPLYIQLASEIATLIQDDVLKSGAKLPSIRVLSKELMINRDTVVSAYKLLVNQGLIDGYIGKGTYVSSASNTDSPYEKTFESVPIYCSHTNFPKELLPEALCMPIAQAIIHDEGWNAFYDPLHRERNFLKQSICSFFNDLGLQASSSSVRVVKHFEDFLAALFRYSPKSGICVEAYRDLSLSSYLHTLGAKIYEIPLTQEGMDLEILEKHLSSGHIAYIFLSSYLQNPTGICYCDTHKQKIIELAQKYDCYIIEDGTLNEFAYYASRYCPLYHTFSQDRVIYVYHFSKIYFPYIPYSFILLPSAMTNYLIDALECTFNERLLRYYLDSSFFKENKKNMLQSSKQKYDLFLSGLKSLENKIECSTQNGGVFLWLKPLGLSCDELCDTLIKNNIIVSPGSLFTHSSQSHYFRLSLSHLTLEETSHTLDLLHQIL